MVCLALHVHLDLHVTSKIMMIVSRSQNGSTLRIEQVMRVLASSGVLCLLSVQ